MQSLNLMGNKLTKLPDRFGDLVGLKKLGLKSNALAQLPGSFTQLTNLVELFITDNQLTELPNGGSGLRIRSPVGCATFFWPSGLAGVWGSGAAIRMDFAHRWPAIGFCMPQASNRILHAAGMQ